MKRSLLLNSNGEPLQFISDVRAIKLMLSGRADAQSGMTGETSYWDEIYASCYISFKLRSENRKGDWKSQNYFGKVSGIFTSFRSRTDMVVHHFHASKRKERTMLASHFIF